MSTPEYMKSYNPEYYKKNRLEMLKRTAERTEKLRLIILEHYGNKCNWRGCSIDDLDMLQIDHINNDGHVDQKNGRIGGNLYRYLINNNFPSGYRVLCANHNWKRYRKQVRERQRGLL